MQFHAVSEGAKLQQLVDYVDGGHGSQLSSNCNTRTLAKHYQDLRLIMRKVKDCLKQDADYVNHCINTTSEDSDGIRSRTSSLESESQLLRAKMSKFTELSSEAVKESKEEVAEKTAEESAEESAEDSMEESYSSADETDDEVLETKLVSNIM